MRETAIKNTTAAFVIALVGMGFLVLAISLGVLGRDIFSAIIAAALLAVSVRASFAARLPLGYGATILTMLGAMYVLIGG